MTDTCPECGQAVERHNDMYIPTATFELMALRKLRDAVIIDPHASITLLDLATRVKNNGTKPEG